MAVVNTKSVSITNLDAVQVTLNPVTLVGGRVRSIADTVEVAEEDSDGSVFRMARVHSSWRIPSIKVLNDAIADGTAYEVGLYQTAANGGAVVDADAYASAVDMSAARTAPVELAFEARNVDKVRNYVWQDAGLTSDPGRFYDLCFTATTVGTAAGTISTLVEYVAD